MAIKKIFEKNLDEEVHNAFLKYGRGEYSFKFLVEVKKQKDKYSIKTSSEYANMLVKKCLEGQGKIKITGVIISTIDLSKEIDFPVGKISNFQGVRKIPIDTEIDSSSILQLMEKYPRVFFALSFKTDSNELKIKPKAPKSGKPGKDSNEPKADFCSLKTNDKKIIDELLFDVDDFKELTVHHTLKITDILYPKDPKLSPTEIREQSKRKGTVVRKINLDGKEKISEAEFTA